MKKKILIILAVSIGIILIYLVLPSGFDPIFGHAEIKQDIGGLLIVDSDSSADFHSWEYNIAYKYKSPDGKIYNIGYGRFVEREWEKNIQLVNYKGWTILKTGGNDGNADKIIIGKLDLNNWVEYEFTPKVIEKEPIWINQKINSAPDNFYSFTRIENITSSGEITILYTYKIKDSIVVETTGSKLIKYQINPDTGVPEIKEIVTS